MKILITGHEGFLGNNLLGKLKRQGHFVIGIDKEQNIAKKLDNFPDISIKGDIRDADLLRRVIVEHEVEVIYHLASWPITRTCSNDPLTTFDINVMGMATLLEVCRTWGKTVKQIIISTSDKAFGNAPVPYTEESPLRPLFTYDTSKACQQLVALSFYNNFQLPIKIVACSNIYGPGDYNLSRVIPKSISRLAKGQKALLWKDSADQVRELVYVDDVADAFLLVAEKGNIGEIYCCGGTEFLRIEDLMIKLCTLMGKDPSQNIEVIERPVSLMELQEQYIDSTKLRALGWNPKYSLDEGLRDCIFFYSNLARKNGNFL